MFADRREAGRLLGQRLREELAVGDEPPIVLGLPRGGVPVAAEVAEALGASLDVLIVRKLGAPADPELAIGAVGPGGATVLQPHGRALDPDLVARIRGRELAELERRERSYRAGRPPLDLRGRSVVLVDDGIATGATALVAVQAARVLGAARVVVAAPVAAPDAATAIEETADRVVALSTPERFWAVGRWYRDFRQTSDEEVLAALAGRP